MLEKQCLPWQHCDINLQSNMSTQVRMPSRQLVAPQACHRCALAGAQQSLARQPPGPPPMQGPPGGGAPFQPDSTGRHLQPPGPPGSFAPGAPAHVGLPPSGGPLEQTASGVPPGSVQDTSYQAGGTYGQPNGAEGVLGQPAVVKQPSLERSTSNSSSAHHSSAPCLLSHGWATCQMTRGC